MGYGIWDRERENKHPLHGLQAVRRLAQIREGDTQMSESEPTDAEIAMAYADRYERETHKDGADLGTDVLMVGRGEGLTPEEVLAQLRAGTGDAVKVLVDGIREAAGRNGLSPLDVAHEGLP